MMRILRIFGGFGLLLVGFVLSLPFVPGPGIPLMILGLVILGEHFPWAKRVVDWGKGKLEGLRSKGRPQNNPPATD
ncbi:MAG: PGPGW domain-containing protein [Bryobacterales bacterium]|nr:PGPGW domain-containing protein [Bryobacterales bacterium]